MLELTALRHFQAVAETRSFSKAARKLFVTQPAVSHQIRGLEKALGVALFQRNPGSIALTDAGRYLQEFCSDLFTRLNEAEVAVQNLRRTVQGTIRFAAPAGIADAWLVPALVRFSKEHAAVDYRLTIGRDEAVRTLVVERLVDFGIVLERIPESAARLAHLPIFDEEYVLLVPGGSGRQRPAPRADEIVFSRRFVAVEEGDYMLRRWLAANYPSKADRVVIAHVANHIPAVLAMVRSGLGAAVLPRHAVAEALEAGDVTEVAPPRRNVTNRFFLVHREQQPMPLSLAKMLEHLVTEARV